VHPVVPILPGAGLELKVTIFVLAAIIAPIVEETMFRGVFYRHLREGTRKFGGVWSFLASALLTSFIFAAIHPQGWRGIPPLMGIAMGLNLAREWRGSLIPSMIAHGINNGLVMAIVLVAVG
jgi:membrane protease YdiL (CAAX protease family)